MTETPGPVAAAAEAPPLVSIVVPFRDWGADRLATHVRNVRDCFGDVPAEIIVSDYGSTGNPVRDRVRALGARYRFTPVPDGVWSRARALNIGLAEARGAIGMITDADMLFSPGTLPRVVAELTADPGQFVILPCFDLPEEVEISERDLPGLDWDALDSVSGHRSRWGMGGLVAFPMSAHRFIRGLDDRMTHWGGEDNDYALRLRRAGLRLHWLEDPAVRMFHMWHPPTRAQVETSAQMQAARERGREILRQDPTVVRNVGGWSGGGPAAHPPVTVAVVTCNRAEMLQESLASVLAQTFQDFEVVVVDDGSTDGTPDVVASFADERIRYVRQENRGAAAARNVAHSLARGDWIVVQDDDDIMLPWRVEAHLSTTATNVHGSYGAYLTFDDNGFTDHRPGYARFDVGTATFMGAASHPTIAVRREVLQAFTYQEHFRGGSDWLVLAGMARAGVTLAHTGRYHIGYRQHGRQITNRHGGQQSYAYDLTTSLLANLLSETEVDALRREAEAVPERFPDDHRARRDILLPWLPDSLVDRTLVVTGDVRTWPVPSSRTRLVEATGADGQVARTRLVVHATWDDMWRLRRAGVPFEVRGRPVGADDPSRGAGPLTLVVDDFAGRLVARDRAATWSMAVADGTHATCVEAACAANGAEHLDVTVDGVMRHLHATPIPGPGSSGRRATAVTGLLVTGPEADFPAILERLR